MKPVVFLPEVEKYFCEITSCVVESVSLHQISESLGNVVDAKDNITFNHSQQVSVVGYHLALALGFNTKQADIIHIAGHLHDIGKMGIPDAVLKKSTSFTNEDPAEPDPEKDRQKLYVIPSSITSTRLPDRGSFFHPPAAPGQFLPAFFPYLRAVFRLHSSDWRHGRSKVRFQYLPSVQQTAASHVAPRVERVDETGHFYTVRVAECQAPA